MVLLLTILTCGQVFAEDFNYGLWGNSGSFISPKASVHTKKESQERKEDTPPAFNWKDFLPKGLPKPFVRLIGNPTQDNVKKYWKAYEEYADKITKTERLLRVLQVSYARKVSKDYTLVYFFSPDCPACREYTPKLFLTLLKEGFTVPTKAYVVGDYKGGALMMSALGVTTVRIATDRMLGEFNVNALPTAALLDVNGDIVQEFSGGDVLRIVNFLKEARDEEITNSNATLKQ